MLNINFNYTLHIIDNLSAIIWPLITKILMMCPSLLKLQSQIIKDPAKLYDGFFNRMKKYIDFHFKVS